MTDSQSSPDTAEVLSGRDFSDMSAPELLAYCGTNAGRWAEAFCRIKEFQGWRTSDIDEGLMIGWFANAIEHSCQVRGVAAGPLSGLLSSDNPYNCRDDRERWLDWDTAWHNLAMEVTRPHREGIE